MDNEKMAVIEKTLAPYCKKVALQIFNQFKQTGLSNEECLFAMEVVSRAIWDYVPHNYKPKTETFKVD